jgi:hypothetical protein
LTPLPSLDPIKGKARDLPREKTRDEKPQDTPQLLRLTSQAIYSFFLFLRLGTASLSHSL